MAASNLNKVSSVLYRAARLSRDARAVQRATQQHSLAPIGRRVERKAVRRIVNGQLGKWGF